MDNSWAALIVDPARDGATSSGSYAKRKKKPITEADIKVFEKVLALKAKTGLSHKSLAFRLNITEYRVKQAIGWGGK